MGAGTGQKKIPWWRLWRVRYVTSRQTSLLPQQQTQSNPKPTASRQELRLLLSSEIRNAIDELYAGRSQIPGERFSRL